MAALPAVVTLLGLLVVGLAVAIAVSPARLIGWIEGLESHARFRLALGTRAIAGVVFLVAAPACRMPLVVQIVGVLMLVAAAGLLVLRRRRLDTIVETFAALDPAYLRVWSVFALAFGALLVYAGA